MIFNNTLIFNNTDNLTAVNASANNTDNLLAAKWSTTTAFTLVTVIGFLTNITVILLFITDRTLRTPFNVYLANLFLANLFCITIQQPMDIAYSVSQSWLIGDGACTVYSYASLVVSADIFCVHALIGLNRFWAVIHPFSYRRFHSFRLAMLFCTGLLAFVHFTVVPCWAMDALYYRLPATPVNGCQLNTDAQPLYTLLIQILTCDLPEVIIVCALPLIYFTRLFSRKFLSKNRITPITTLTTGQNSKTDEPHKNKPKSEGFLVLALMTASVVVCWTPSNVYYTVISFVTIEWPVDYSNVAAILGSCQTLLDPVLFVMALPNLRKSLRRFCPVTVPTT